jgi:sugar lactone lactonase YvrE
MRKSALTRSWVGFIVVCLLAVASQAQNSITTVAGGGPTGVAATSASVGFPFGVARFGGNTYFTDSRSNRVFKVDDATKTLTVVVGDTLAGNTGDYDPNNNQAQPATMASLNGPLGLAVDSAGNVYIADTNSAAIRVLNPSGSTVTIAGVQIGAAAISTVVGCVTAPCSQNDTSPLSVVLNVPAGVALDANGNIYIADTGNHAIRVVNVGATDLVIGAVTVHAGQIGTIAGTLGAFGSSGDGGLANAATMDLPSGVFVDGNGYIYIADTFNSAIRVVNPTGSDITVANVLIHAGDIQTVAGTITSACTPPSCGDGGAATTAQLNFPDGLAVDGSGNIYVADTKDQVVRKVDASGTISAYAGIYAACGSAANECGDGALATNALLAAPAGVAVDGSDVYIADQNNDAVRVVTAADNNINSVAGTLGINQFYVEYFGDNPSSPATNADLFFPTAVAIDNTGNTFIADSFNSVIRKVDAASGNISLYVGQPQTFCNVTPCGDGGNISGAFLSFPTDIFIDGSGNMYIADYQPAIGGSPGLAVIRKITGNTIKTVVGNYNSGPGYTGDGGSALNAQLGQGTYGNTPPLGVYVDKAGIIYVVDSLNHAIRAVNTTSAAVTIAGRSIGAGNIDTIAGNGTAGFSGDGGQARSAQLNNPLGVAVDASGNIYIGDSVNNRIRKVTTAGIISTFAGTGNACASQGCGDGGPATSADLDLPSDVLVDYAGNVFLSDTADFAVREVTTDGNITTVMGQQRRGFGGDGTAGLLAEPLGLGFDAAGNIYTADFAQWRIRKVAAIAATAPTATPNPASLSFPGQTINTTSSSKAITITNSGNITALTITNVALTGTNAGDFAISNNTCPASLAAGANCEIDVTFTPTATGNRTADVTITDNAPNNPQNIAVSGTGTGAPDFVLPAPTPGTQTVTAGSAASYTVSVTAQNGFNSAVTLSCTAGVPTGAACSFSPASITPGQSSTLTITTTAARAALDRPAKGRQSLFYAIWLLLPAMVLSTAGIAAPRRKKLLSWVLLALTVSGLLFLVACGGGSSSGGGGGGGGGTPANTYHITIQGAAQGFTSQTTQVTLVVQ